jgi:hypothetical protein
LISTLSWTFGYRKGKDACFGESKGFLAVLCLHNWSGGRESFKGCYAKVRKGYAEFRKVCQLPTAYRTSWLIQSLA